MKKRLMILLLGLMGTFALLSCNNHPDSFKRASLREEYSVYTKGGGNLSYEEWLKKKIEKIETKVTIKSFEVNSKDELIVELTNGQIINAGKIPEYTEEITIDSTMNAEGV